MSEFFSVSSEEAVRKLKTNAKKGLEEAEAKKRLQKYGPNRLPKEKPLSWFFILVSQLKNPLVYILGFAAVISIVLGEFIDFGIIAVAILLNVAIGFFQEYKADRTMQKLKKLIRSKARVLRGGLEHEINSDEVVVGDIVHLEAGDNVPADCRLIEINNLRSTEASLTGESVPSKKSIKIIDKGTPLADRENMVYMGTQVADGNAKAVVCSTGTKTELGKIALLVKETKEEKTPLQKKFARLSKVISIIVAVIVFIIFIIGIIRNHDFYEMVLTSIAIAVAAIPEGLPAAVAIALAVAMQKILKRKGLVKRLIAAETLGSTSIICTDKTGTLTKGEMAVSKIITWGKNEEETKPLALKIGLLNNDAAVENPEAGLEDWKVIGSPTEKALLLAALGSGLKRKELEEKEQRIGEIPFSGRAKYMATLHKKSKGGGNIAYLKGAPERMVEMSKYYLNNGDCRIIDENFKERLKDQIDELTNRGLRVLAVGYKETSEYKLDEVGMSGFVLVGLIALKDPLRKEAKETIKLCREAGIRPVLITGDHKLTATSIAKEIGLKVSEKEVMEGGDVDSMSDDALKKAVKKTKIFARIEPKHKTRIVKAWQRRGEVVAMVGDGVNDAPAIKGADVGVALGSGTDVAKETSDIILMNNNLATLVAAVREGRVSFDNIKKVTLYLLADAFSEILLIGGALLMGLPIPILAAQILWINLVEDGLPVSALAFEPGEKEAMKEKPRKLTEPILDYEMKIIIFTIGFVNDFLILALYWWLYQQGNVEMDKIRTIIFVTLSVDALLYVFSCRSLRHTIFTKNPFSNKLLVAAVGMGALLLLSGVYFPPFQTILRTVPLALNDWILPLIIAIISIVLIEIVKEIFIVRRKRGKY